MEVWLLISGDNQENSVSEEKHQFDGFDSTSAKRSRSPEKFLSVQEILWNWAAEKKTQLQWYTARILIVDFLKYISSKFTINSRTEKEKVLKCCSFAFLFKDNNDFFLQVQPKKGVFAVLPLCSSEARHGWRENLV